MYDITTAMLAYVLFHLITIYVCGVVLRLDYKIFLAVTTAVSIAVTLVLRAGSVAWKHKAQSFVQEEDREGTLWTDLLVGLGILILGGVASAAMIYKLYGVGGWLGITATNMIVSYIV
jgi:hypothetical protein